MENSSEENKTEWIVSGCLFSTIGVLSLIPPLKDAMLSFLDPGVSALASVILCAIGIVCFITYFIKK